MGVVYRWVSMKNEQYVDRNIVKLWKLVDNIA